MEWLNSALTAMMSVVTNTFEYVTGNPFFATILVGGTLIPIGIRIYRKFRR